MLHHDIAVLIVQGIVYYKIAACLRCIQDDIDIFPEVHSIVLQDSEQEAVRQPKGCARLHGCKYPRVQLCLSSAHHEFCYQLYLIAWHSQRSLGALKQLLETYIRMGLF